MLETGISYIAGPSLMRSADGSHSDVVRFGTQTTASGTRFQFAVVESERPLQEGEINEPWPFVRSLVTVSVRRL